MASFRASRRLLLGQYSRMLDLGGMPQGKSGPIRPLDASKNSKIRAIAFDFDLLTRSVDSDKTNPTTKHFKTSSLQTTTTPVTPDMNKVENIANLLNVDLEGKRKSKPKDEFRDDLSGLTGETAPPITDRQANTRKKQDIRDEAYDDSRDVRSKYAAKLRKKVGGGGLESAIQQRQEALTKGDASSHLAARAAAAASSPSSTKWLASTGTGNLLTYVTNRSIKVALMPIPQNENAIQEGVRMQDFTKQLSNLVSVDLMVKDGENATNVLTHILKELKVPPEALLIVSDRDDYLKAAKDAGMMACRIRPENARRGNITAHYNVPKVADVQEVVNEMNGISFNAIFSSNR